MTRRRFIAIVSLCVLAMLGTVVLGAVLFVTQTDYGREWMRSTIEAQIARAVNGPRLSSRIARTNPPPCAPVAPTTAMTFFSILSATANLLSG